MLKILYFFLGGKSNLSDSSTYADSVVSAYSIDSSCSFNVLVEGSRNHSASLAKSIASAIGSILLAFLIVSCTSPASPDTTGESPAPGIFSHSSYTFVTSTSNLSDGDSIGSILLNSEEIQRRVADKLGIEDEAEIYALTEGRDYNLSVEIAGSISSAARRFLEVTRTGERLVVQARNIDDFNGLYDILIGIVPFFSIDVVVTYTDPVSRESATFNNSVTVNLRPIARPPEFSDFLSFDQALISRVGNPAGTSLQRSLSLAEDRLDASFPLGVSANSLTAYGIVVAEGGSNVPTIFFDLVNSTGGSCVINDGVRDVEININNINYRVRSARPINYEGPADIPSVSGCRLAVSFNGTNYKPLALPVSHGTNVLSAPNPVLTSSLSTSVVLGTASNSSAACDGANYNCHYATVNLAVTNVDEAPTIRLYTNSNFDIPAKGFFGSYEGAGSREDLESYTEDGVTYLVDRFELRILDEDYNDAERNLPSRALDKPSSYGRPQNVFVSSVSPGHGEGVFALAIKDPEVSSNYGHYNLTVDPGELDYEKFSAEELAANNGKAIYKISITARDPGGKTTTRAFDFEVRDVDEAASRATVVVAEERNNANLTGDPAKDYPIDYMRSGVGNYTVVATVTTQDTSALTSPNDGSIEAVFTSATRNICDFTGGSSTKNAISQGNGTSQELASDPLTFSGTGECIVNVAVSENGVMSEIQQATFTLPTYSPFLAPSVFDLEKYRVNEGGTFILTGVKIRARDPYKEGDSVSLASTSLGADCTVRQNGAASYDAAGEAILSLAISRTDGGDGYCDTSSAVLTIDINEGGVGPAPTINVALAEAAGMLNGKELHKALYFEPTVANMVVNSVSFLFPDDVDFDFILIAVTAVVEDNDVYNEEYSDKNAFTVTFSTEFPHVCYFDSQEFNSETITYTPDSATDSPFILGESLKINAPGECVVTATAASSNGVNSPSVSSTAGLISQRAPDVLLAGNAGKTSGSLFNITFNPTAITLQITDNDQGDGTPSNPMGNVSGRAGKEPWTLGAATTTGTVTTAGSVSVDTSGCTENQLSGNPVISDSFTEDDQFTVSLTASETAATPCSINVTVKEDGLTGTEVVHIGFPVAPRVTIETSGVVVPGPSYAYGRPFEFEFAITGGDDSAAGTDIAVEVTNSDTAACRISETDTSTGNEQTLTLENITIDEGTNYRFIWVTPLKPAPAGCTIAINAREGVATGSNSTTITLSEAAPTVEIVRVDDSNMTVSDSDPLTSYDRIRFRATVTDNDPDNNQYQLMLQAGTQGSNDAPGVCDIIETGIVVDNNPYDGGFTGNPPRNSNSYSLADSLAYSSITNKSEIYFEVEQRSPGNCEVTANATEDGQASSGIITIELILMPGSPTITSALVGAAGIAASGTTRRESSVFMLDITAADIVSIDLSTSGCVLKDGSISASKQADSEGRAEFTVIQKNGSVGGMDCVDRSVHGRDSGGSISLRRGSDAPMTVQDFAVPFVPPAVTLRLDSERYHLLESLSPGGESTSGVVADTGSSGDNVAGNHIFAFLEGRRWDTNNNILTTLVVEKGQSTGKGLEYSPLGAAENANLAPLWGGGGMQVDNDLRYISDVFFINTTGIGADATVLGIKVDADGDAEDSAASKSMDDANYTASFFGNLKDHGVEGYLRLTSPRFLYQSGDVYNAGVWSYATSHANPLMKIATTGNSAGSGFSLQARLCKIGDIAGVSLSDINQPSAPNFSGRTFSCDDSTNAAVDNPGDIMSIAAGDGSTRGWNWGRADTGIVTSSISEPSSCNGISYPIATGQTHQMICSIFAANMIPGALSSGVEAPIAYTSNLAWNFQHYIENTLTDLAGGDGLSRGLDVDAVYLAELYPLSTTTGEVLGRPLRVILEIEVR